MSWCKSDEPSTVHFDPNKPPLLDNCSWEIYWDKPKGAFTDLNLSSEAVEVKDRILRNLLVAAKQAKIQHMVVVDDGSLVPQLEASGVPYTCIHAQELTDTLNYSFKDGVCGDLTISTADEGSKGGGAAVCREDLAAICVQSLQSLNWAQSRHLVVSSNGPLVDLPSEGKSEKRVDQQWCVNSYILESKMEGID